jgi:hypothetical protein
MECQARHQRRDAGNDRHDDAAARKQDEKAETLIDPLVFRLLIKDGPACPFGRRGLFLIPGMRLEARWMALPMPDVGK